MPDLYEQIAADSAAQQAAMSEAAASTVNANAPGEFAADSETPEAPEAEPATETPDAPSEPVEAAPEPHKEPDETAERFKRERLAKKAAQREAAELKSRLEAIQAGHQPAIDDAAVSARAEQIAQAKVFDQECNSIADAGRKAFPDFADAVSDLWDAMGVPAGQVHVPIIEAAIEAGEPHKILYHLGQNPDEAERIARLPLHRQGAAVAKLAGKLNAPPPPKPVSRAPTPVTPVQGVSAAPVERDPAKMSIADYMKMENDKFKERMFPKR